MTTIDGAGRLEQRGARKVFVVDDPAGQEATLTDADVRELVEQSRQWPRD
jgi:hypothetical protein